MQLITQIILARLLLPEQFGLIAMIAIFIGVGRIFADGGFGQALIQKREIDDIDKTSVFIISTFVSFFFYIIVFFTSSLISSFLGYAELELILKILAIIIVTDAIGTIQNSILIKNLDFKKIFFISMISNIAYSISGITFAYLGYGVWSLVFSQIIRSVVNTFALWLIVRWMPKRHFSLSRLKSLFKFGSGIFATSLLRTIFSNFYSVAIGKTFNAETLGYYNRGDTLPLLAVNSINEPIKIILFPSLTQIQNDYPRIVLLIRRIVRIETFLIFPLMAVLALIAEPLVIFLLTDKWLLAVPFIVFAAIKSAFAPLHTTNLEALKAIGRSDIFLLIAILKNIISISALFIALPYGIYAVALAGVITSLINLMINIYPIKRLLNHGFINQMLDFLPNMAITLVMAGLLFLMNHFIIGDLHNALIILINLAVGGIVYIALAYVTKNKSLIELFALINETFRKKKQK